MMNSTRMIAAREPIGRSAPIPRPGRRSSSKCIAGALLGLALCAQAADKPWEVRDANGKLMGRFIGAPTVSSAVQLTVGGKKYVVRVYSAFDAHGQPSVSEIDYLSDPVYFKSTDCTGMPYVWTGLFWGTRWAVVNVSASGQVLLYPAGTVTETVQLRSERDQTGNCIAANYPTGAAAEAPIDITTMFKRPFTLH